MSVYRPQSPPITELDLRGPLRWKNLRAFVELGKDIPDDALVDLISVRGGAKCLAVVHTKDRHANG